MAISLFGKSKSSMAAFLGFTKVRPVLNEAGQERFGLIEVAPEYTAEFFPVETSRKRPVQKTVLTAALRLSGPGLNRWLAEGREDASFFARLCQALPGDSPAQFWLRRRRGQLKPHYLSWRQRAYQRLSDPEIASVFAQDYLESVIYKVEDSGLADIWCGLLISGRNEEEVAGRLAWLVASLPCEATPCTSAELSALLLDYFAPGMLEAELEDFQSRPEILYADWLEQVSFEFSGDGFFNGSASAYWTLSAPPLKNEMGWTRGLLENEALAASEFDITVHLAPAHQETTMREVLERRRLSLEGQFNNAMATGRRVEAQELYEQKHEVERRLEALVEGQQRYFEIGISLALHSRPDDFEADCDLFEEELEGCGLAAHRTLSYQQTRCATLDCAPLNLSQFDRPFVLPADEAGRLAQLGSSGQPQLLPDQPLVGLSPGGEAVYLNPASRPGQTAFFLLGEAGKSSAREAHCLVRYLTAMRVLRGETLCGFDSKGEWLKLAQQFGGRYVAFGPYENEFHFNPLEVSAESLNQLSELEKWVSEMGRFLTALLDLNPEQSEDLSAVLLGAAIERASHQQQLNAASLWIRAETSGFEAIVEPLKQLCLGRRYGWLFARPTRLPKPGQFPLLFLGLSPEVRGNWNEETRRYYFSRLFARFAMQAGAHLPERPYLFLIDSAQELLSDPLSAHALAWINQNAKNFRTSLWLLTPRAEEWLNSYTGRNLLERAQTQLFFNQNSPGLAGLARRLNLSQRFLKTVHELVPGAALVRQLDEDGEAVLFSFEGLPYDYTHRLADPARLAAPSTPPPAERSKPLEVPLFASEEIWDDSDLEDLQGEAEPSWDAPGIEPYPAVAYA